MGLFSFLKKKEKEVVIGFHEISDWLDDFLESKNLGKRVEEFKKDLQDTSKELLSQLEDLGKASLMNENIPERAKHIMKGNREEYIRKMKTFVDNIEIPEDYKEIGFFTSSLSETINELGENTQKNFFVLKEFFEKEVRNIAGKVKKIEDTVIDFRREIDNEDLGIVEDVKIKLKHLSENVQKQKELNKEKEEVLSIIKELKEKRGKIKKKLEKLKQSSSYDRFKELLDKKESLQNKIDSARKELQTDFSGIERALKKYTHNSPDEKIAVGYMKDATEALKRDKDLKIGKILEELKEKADSLDLKNVDKVKGTLEKLSSSYLKKQLELINKTRDEISALTKRLKSDMTALTISEQEMFMREINKKIESQEDYLEQVEMQLEPINLNLLRQKIKAKVKELDNVLFEDEVEKEEKD